MTLKRWALRVFAMVAVVGLAGCKSLPPGGPPAASKAQIEALATAIVQMNPEVDPIEAATAARLAYDYPLHLAKEYELEDPPLVHNMKVNRGTKPRGLCYQWADDMQARLAREEFETLRLHRAIANSENPILIDHSTVIISSKSEGLFEGIILDPWRNSGVLFWSEVLEDKRYDWIPRQEVFARKLAHQRR
ncbi:hypothetical protein [Actibacterium pelagium]|uniref:Lipoprotein n=1 Tax=Actibacterium pelagium TaxID=2029103 RepID=A0A917ACH2_9RHOB|nr:hypothetical protein [Actibacterium pelagium]GGE40870.1 hypothetical protein GCM10011517_05670 [Actibacterium pelagium]